MVKMRNKTIKIILFYVFIFFLITEACTRKNCLKLDAPVEREYLDTLSLHCYFLKRSSDKNVYLINPVDSNLLCDINTLFYYKEDNSRYILVFNSCINEKYYIAIIQNEQIDVQPCCDVLKICETNYPDKLVIEVYDSLLQFNTLSYGHHRLELKNNTDSILYNYTDTIIYDNNY
jgi:hypothetical protein